MNHKSNKSERKYKAVERGLQKKLLSMELQVRRMLMVVPEFMKIGRYAPFLHS